MGKHSNIRKMRLGITHLQLKLMAIRLMFSMSSVQGVITQEKAIPIVNIVLTAIQMMTTIVVMPL